MAGKKKVTFEESIKQIDDLINLLENGEINLEESIGKYEESMKLIKNCYKILDSAEGKIKKIVEENGKIETKDFD